MRMRLVVKIEVVGVIVEWYDIIVFFMIDFYLEVRLGWK